MTYNTPYLRLAQFFCPSAIAATWLLWRPYAIHVDRERWDRLSGEQQERLIRHELVHIKQRELEGWLMPVKYIWFHFKYGYKNNPYEIEANKNI